MIKEVFDAPKTLQLSVGRLELQRDVSVYSKDDKSSITHVIRDTMNGEISGRATMGRRTSSLNRTLRQILLWQKEFSVNWLYFRRLSSMREPWKISMALSQLNDWTE
jgi:hypothetical protein